ncbi:MULTISPECIES: protein phosphatase 2C domain-containing protein [unclassified Microcoleus]|uniref:protein phosphatase 2C domain-containing protein n=1 Tax=unclassified Microcoleus TaxID=2642155 RepID=UPI0025DDA808|nr:MULTISPECIES: protein phosphatase 2C domain-containing protein [unclassified Microcoleus]
MPKHYLWAVGEGIKACKPGDLIAGRYLVKRDRLLVDTQPEQLPEMPEEIPSSIAPYLRLFAYQLHVPQVYGLVSSRIGKLSGDIWLLENAPILKVTESLMPELADTWKGAEAMRQLNWLWQIAKVWQPFIAQGVAATLLTPELLRVEGQLVRFLELQPDRKPPNLSQLGKLWQQWIDDAHPAIANFLRQLCQQMVAGQVRHGEQLMGQLDKALAKCGRFYDRTVEIATGTDVGRARAHNEDACYPPDGTVFSGIPGSEACAIVCDGIGGQDGGEVASELAITVLREKLQQMPLHQANWDPLSLTSKLERSACAANDKIAGRNDTEHRQGRQRMGTTLVMGLAHIHELYVAHVGDSRAYWITRSGCYQVTLDDDVACREVRLGYSLYRDALEQVAAGALIQALGITSSNTLHPTVQRFPVDEDCVLLLCSDGLSDKDRVEQCWEEEILPILDGSITVAKARDRLIEIANTRNGHDNVTVALIHCQAHLREESNTLTELSVAPLEVPIDLISDSEDMPTDLTESPSLSDTNSQVKTQLVRSPQKGKSLFTLLVKIVFLLGLGGVFAYFFIPPVGRAIDTAGESLFGKRRLTNPINGPEKTVESAPTASKSLEKGSFIEIKSSASGELEKEGDRLDLRVAIGESPVKGTVPAGSILQVTNKQLTPQGNWLELKVCSIPEIARSNSPKPKLNKDFSNVSTPAISPSPAVATSSPSPAVPNPALSPAVPNPSLSPAVATSSPSPTVKPTVGVESAKLQAGEIGWIQEQDAVSKVATNPSPNPNQQGKCAVASDSNPKTN